MNHFDDVAIDRALRGDRTVRLTEDDLTEVGRRVVAGELDQRVLWTVLGMSGTKTKQFLSDLRRTS